MLDVKKERKEKQKKKKRKEGRGLEASPHFQCYSPCIFYTNFV